MTAEDLVALVRPVFVRLLSDAELMSLGLEVVWLHEPDGTALLSSGPIDGEGVAVRWSILGEQGWSGELDPRAGVAALQRAVLGDVQDFIAESGFGWGQLRLPPATA
ncbi:hypothetical protein [Frigoribacterium salinisoli]